MKTLLVKRLSVLLFSTLLFSILIGATSAFSTADDSIPGPAVGAEFPHSLNAPDQTGEAQSIDTLMGDKGLVIVFLRSADWCRFCKAQLVDLNERLAEFQALGLNIVSISVDGVDEIATFSEKRKIGFSMLADPDGDINRELGIRDSKMGSSVPRPILYVVDQSGTIQARYMDPTYRTRPDLDAVLSDVAALDSPLNP